MSPITPSTPTKRASVSFRRWLLSFLAAAAIAAISIGQIAASSPAQAGEGCDNSKGFICGRAMNGVDSSRTINVHDHWTGSDPGGKVKILDPGKWSPFKDTDAYCVPPNTHAFAFIVGPLTKEKWWEARTEVEYPVSDGWRCRKIGDPQIAMVFAFKPADVGKKLPASSSPNAPDWAGMRAKAKAGAKAKAVKVCKIAKKVAKNQKSAYYKKYKKYFVQCANLGVKVPKK